MSKERSLGYLSRRARRVIGVEVRADLAPARDQDLQTKRLLRQEVTDWRTSAYLFLDWLKEGVRQGRVLYPASGHDRIPKEAFGLERVVHTSLESVGSFLGSGQYFPSLGDGRRVVADNTCLPFADSVFQIVLALDTPWQFLGGRSEEVVRVLRPGGFIVLAENVFLTELKESARVKCFRECSELEERPVPNWLQKKGAAEAEFFLFRKTDLITN